MKTLDDYKKLYDNRVRYHIKPDCSGIMKDYNEDDAISMVSISGYNLMYVKNQTDAICLAAVKKNGYALQYVHNQTEEMCLIALEYTINTLRYVDPNLFYKNHKKLLEGLEE